MSDLQLFDVEGAGIQFGATDDGTPYAVAPDIAKALGYRDAFNALRLLDDAEKGTQIVRTPGGPQQVTVIYEDGLWELIFRSTLPGAKAIKARVKAILREIRETGSYRPAELDELEVARRYVAALEAKNAEEKARLAAEAKAAELEAPASAWNTLASARGDYSVREAAAMLVRDHGIKTGQNRLFATLRQLGLLDRTGQPYARHYALIRAKAQFYRDPYTGEEVAAAPQPRITVRGLEYLLRHLKDA